MEGMATINAACPSTSRAGAHAQGVEVSTQAHRQRVFTCWVRVAAGRVTMLAPFEGPEDEVAPARVFLEPEASNQ